MVEELFSAYNLVFKEGFFQMIFIIISFRLCLSNIKTVLKVVSGGVLKNFQIVTVYEKYL